MRPEISQSLGDSETAVPQWGLKPEEESDMSSLMQAGSLPCARIERRINCVPFAYQLSVCFGNDHITEQSTLFTFFISIPKPGKQVLVLNFRRDE